MTISPSPALKASTPPPHVPQLHTALEICPLCEQRLPPDRLDEMKERIAHREQAQTASLTSRLQEQFEREKRQALDQIGQEAAALLTREKQEAAVREAKARIEGRQAAEALVREKVAAAELAGKEAQAAMQARIDQAEAAKTAAEQARAGLRTELDQMRRNSDAAIEKLKLDAAAKESTIRAEARQVAERAIQEKLATMQQAHKESEVALNTRIEQAEVAKTIAQGTSTALQTQLDQSRRDYEAAMEKMKQDAAARENAVRLESVSQVQALMHAKITQAEQAKAAAETKATAAEQRIRALQETHDVQLAQRLLELREALEKDKTNAVNAEKSAAFEEKMKLSGKVEELQRSIDKKTAEELGEGAELDLFEELKGEFEGDHIERINRGQPGADILHVVTHNGRECGKIIYDSKNHNAWRYEFVTKLATDKVAAKAEHAILSTRKFPQDTHQLHNIDGVILASPARVVALVKIVRQHLVQTSILRLSNEERAQKTAALYAFITSERCADLFARIDAHAEDFLELQAKEMKAHQATWKRQGELARSIQKIGAEVCNEVDMIVGTAETLAKVANE